MNDTGNETTEDNATDGAGGGWMTGRATLVLAAGFLAFVVVAAAGVLGYRLLGGHPGHPPQNRTSASLPAPTNAPTPGDGFGLPSADSLGRTVAHPNSPAGQPLAQVSVTSPDYRCDSSPTCPAAPAPQGVVWQEVKPWVLPFSTSDGPARIAGPLALGYTRTPQGAALAGWQITWRSAISRADFDAVLARQIVGTPEDLAQMRTTKQWDYSGTAALALRPSAFRVTAWEDSFAAIEYAAPSHDPGVWNVVPIEVVWQDGDWRMRAPHTPAPQLTVVSLSGWTPW